MIQEQRYNKIINPSLRADRAPRLIVRLENFEKIEVVPSGRKEWRVGTPPKLRGQHVYRHSVSVSLVATADPGFLNCKRFGNAERD